MILSAYVEETEEEQRPTYSEVQWQKFHPAGIGRASGAIQLYAPTALQQGEEVEVTVNYQVNPPALDRFTVGIWVGRFDSDAGGIAGRQRDEAKVASNGWAIFGVPFSESKRIKLGVIPNQRQVVVAGLYFNSASNVSASSLTGGPGWEYLGGSEAAYIAVSPFPTGAPKPGDNPNLKWYVLGAGIVGLGIWLMVKK